MLAIALADPVYPLLHVQPAEPPTPFVSAGQICAMQSPVQDDGASPTGKPPTHVKDDNETFPEYPLAQMQRGAPIALAGHASSEQLPNQPPLLKIKGLLVEPVTPLPHALHRVEVHTKPLLQEQ